LLTQPDGYLDLAPVVAGATGFATVLYRGVDQGAAGHYSAGSVGRLYFGSVCYQFETRVAKAQFANYPIGTVDEFDDADEERTAERLMEIMAQVTLPDGRSGLWGREADGRSGLWGREAAGSGDGGRE